MQSPAFSPLSVISRYLSSQFLGLFFPILLSFVLLYIVIDSFDRMDVFLRHDATFSEAARYMLFKIPLMLTQITPPAVVVAVLMGLGMISRHNEIIAFRTSGISLIQTMVPIMACTLAISVAGLGVERNGRALLFADVSIRQQRRDSRARNARNLP